MEELNQMRHVMWSNLAPYSKTITPQKLVPLSTDKETFEPSLTLEEYLEIAKKYKPKANA